MRDALHRRIAALEDALALRTPSPPPLLWHCAADFVSAADRRAAAEHAGRIGKPSARILFLTIVDARRDRLSAA
jgi:hypothetical protein